MFTKHFFHFRHIRFSFFIIPWLFCGIFPAFLVAEESIIPQQVIDCRQATEQCIAEQNYAGACENYQAIIKAFPGTDYAFDSLYQLAVLHIKKRGDNEAADEVVQTLLSDYSGHREIGSCTRRIATAYLSEHQPAPAKQLSEMALIAWPNHLDKVLVQRNLAIAHVQLGEYAEAEAATARLLADYYTNPETSKGIRKIAYAYFKSNQFTQAKELCQTALSNWPDHAEAIFTRRDLVINHIRLGEYAEAEAATEKLLASYPDHVEIGNCIGRIASYYFDPHKPDKAKALCQLALSNWPEHADAGKTRCTLVSSFVKLGELEHANEATAKLMADYFDHAEIGDFVRKIAYYYYDHDQPAHAKELYQTVLNNWPQTSDIALAQVGLAAATLKLGDCASAEAATARLLSDYSEHKNFDGAVNWLADQYFRESHKTKALDLFRLVLGRNPGSDEQFSAYAGLARVYARLGEDEKVQEQMDRLCLDFHENPKFGEMVLDIAEEYYFRGNKQLEMNFKKEAENSYLAAIQILQDSVTLLANREETSLAFYVIAYYKSLLGELDEAKEIYRYVAETYSDTESAQKARSFLYRMDLQNLDPSDAEAAKSCYDSAFRDWMRIRTGKLRLLYTGRQGKRSVSQELSVDFTIVPMAEQKRPEHVRIPAVCSFDGKTLTSENVLDPLNRWSGSSVEKPPFFLKYMFIPFEIMAESYCATVESDGVGTYLKEHFFAARGLPIRISTPEETLDFGDEEQYLFLVGRNREDQFWFAKEKHELRRAVVSNSALTRQIDYLEYRTYNGIKFPSEIYVRIEKGGSAGYTYSAQILDAMFELFE